MLEDMKFWQLALISSLTLLSITLVLASGTVQVGVFDPKTLKPTDQGDLFTVQNGEPAQRLTTWGHNFAPVISRDGRFGVYRSKTQASLDADAIVGAPGPPSVVNLYVLDLERLKILKLTSQGAIRSDVVWSPDSGAFAWLESRPGTPDTVTGPNRLMLYALKQGRTRELLGGVPSNGGVGGWDIFYLRWTSRGILVAADPTDTLTNFECYLVDVAHGGRIRRATVPKAVPAYKPNGAVSDETYFSPCARIF